MKLEINNIIKILNNQGVILYPTDTVWGIGCDATNDIAVHKIFEIKQRDEQKSLVILVDSIEMLRTYINDIPVKAKTILKEASKPTTLIYNAPIGLACNVIANDNTVAIRLVQDEFCSSLINQFGKPIVSTSANLSGKSTPMSFNDIEPAILKGVDYVVNLHREKIATQTSRIIKILDSGELQILRD